MHIMMGEVKLDMNRNIWQVYGTDAHQMTMKLLEESHAIDLVPQGGTVALKPNFVVSDVPENGAVTHPGVVSACIEYFQTHGITDISVIESCWVGDETMRAMRKNGCDKVLKKYNIPFYDLKKDTYRRVSSPIGHIEVCERALNATLLVDLPVLKGHCQTRMTCALKNLKGCIPDREKRRFHSLGLMEPIAALGSILKPGLIIVDSICGDLNFEEGGTPVHTNRMYLGTDAVQVDAYGCSLMGLDVEDVPYIHLAEEYGAGDSSWSHDDLVMLNEPTDAMEYPKPSGTVARLTKHVHQDKACSACFASLVRALYTNSGSTKEIYIGQGWQGKAMTGLGIGRCAKGATECVMGCPPTPEAILKHLQ